jgi:hypothetical protein
MPNRTLLAALIFAWARVLWAQDIAAPAPLPKSGVQISSISAYGDYYSSSLPNNGFQPTAVNLPFDFGGGGSIQFDWMKFTDRTTFSLSYTPSYTARWRYSSLDALNHLFSLNISQKIAPRWNFSFSVAANLSNYEESLFAPTTLSNVASTPATFQDLTGALLSSNFTNNPHLGIVLTNSPLSQSPVNTLLYGEKMLTASARTSLSYSFSPRLSITFTGGGGRTQNVSQNQAVNLSNSYVIQATTSANAGVALSYSLSPLTQLGATVTATRTVSQLWDGYNTTSLATLGRTLGERWFMLVHGGFGVTSTVRSSTLGLGAEPQPVVGASLGYKTSSHTFLGTYDRTTAGSYGLGASTSSAATGTWHWRRPASSWWLETSGSWQQFTGNALANTSGWRATAGLNRAVGRHAFLSTQYSYQNYSGGLEGAIYHTAQSAVRVAVTWTPMVEPPAR